MDPAQLITDSEYLETHLIVVPSNIRKDFLKSYESIAPMVVPRSAVELAKDEEFVLYAVTTFKKHSSEFLQKCRESKWTPRQYKYVEGGKEEEQKELDRVAREEKKVWGEALRLGRTGWSEAVMVWAHVLTLRVFVETVLRYGLPLEYVSALIKVSILLNNATGWFTDPKLDKSQVGEEGQDLAGLGILLPRRKRLWEGQEGQGGEGRRSPQLGDGSSWSWCWGGQRIYSICVL